MSDIKTSTDQTNVTFDGTFDEERAKALITNLREDIKAEKAKRHALEGERDNALNLVKEHVTKIETLETSLQEQTQRASDAEASTTALNTLRTKEALLDAAQLPRELVDNITGENEDDWQASVEKLSTVLAAGSGLQQRRPDPPQTADADNDPQAELATMLFGS